MGMMRQSGSGRRIRGLAVVIHRIATPLGVFYLSIETRVNAAGFSATIAGTLHGPGRGRIPGGRSAKTRTFKALNKKTRRKCVGFIEFCGVGCGVGGVHGVWPAGGLWDSTRRLCADASAAAASGGEGPAGSGSSGVRQGLGIRDWHRLCGQ